MVHEKDGKPPPFLTPSVGPRFQGSTGGVLVLPHNNHRLTQHLAQGCQVQNTLIRFILEVLYN